DRHGLARTDLVVPGVADSLECEGWPSLTEIFSPSLDGLPPVANGGELPAPPCNPTQARDEQGHDCDYQQTTACPKSFACDRIAWRYDLCRAHRPTSVSTARFSWSDALHDGTRAIAGFFPATAPAWNVGLNTGRRTRPLHRLASRGTT